MAKTPLPEQARDARFLLGQNERGGCDFSEPGAGKTITALEAARLFGRGRPLLIAAPPIALRMWTDEASAHIDGAKVQRISSGRDKIAPGTDIVVVSYDIAKQKSMANRLRRFVAGGMAILDEADGLKTLDSQRCRAFYGNRAEMEDCILEDAAKIWPLTGTPIRRYSDDMFPHLMAVFPEVMERYKIDTLMKFRQRFCVMVQKQFHVCMRPTMVPTDNKNMQELRSIVYGQKLAVRRTVQEMVANMPPLTERVIEVPFETKRELWEAMQGVKLDDLTGMVERQDPVLSKVRRLLAAAKAPAVADYVSEVHEEEDSGLLVLFWHHEAANILQERLSSHLRVQRIDGSVSARKKEQIEDRFNAGEVDVLLGQIGSMGVSLNLQKGGRHAIFAERDWSPAAMDQALKRLWRMGQEKHVQIDYCDSEHELDEAISVVLARKQLGINQFHAGADSG